MRAIFIPYDFDSVNLLSLNKDLNNMTHIVREFSLKTGQLIIVDNVKTESDDRPEQPVAKSSY